MPDSVTQGWRGDYTWRYFLWRHLEDTDLAQHVDFVGHRSDPAYWFDWDVQDPDRYADPDFDCDHGAKYGGTLQEIVEPDSYDFVDPDAPRTTPVSSSSPPRSPPRPLRWWSR